MSLLNDEIIILRPALQSRVRWICKIDKKEEEAKYAIINLQEVIFILGQLDILKGLGLNLQSRRETHQRLGLQRRNSEDL